MATQGQTSHHLTAARQLLDDVMAGDSVDPQVKATAAAAHATLVLAEQVAAVRLVMAAEAVEAAEPPPRCRDDATTVSVPGLSRVRDFYRDKRSRKVPGTAEPRLAADT